MKTMPKLTRTLAAALLLSPALAAPALAQNYAAESASYPGEVPADAAQLVVIEEPIPWEALRSGGGPPSSLMQALSLRARQLDPNREIVLAANIFDAGDPLSLSGGLSAEALADPATRTAYKRWALELAALFESVELIVATESDLQRLYDQRPDLWDAYLDFTEALSEDLWRVRPDLALIDGLESAAAPEAPSDMLARYRSLPQDSYETRTYSASSYGGGVGYYDGAYPGWSPYYGYAPYGVSPGFGSYLNVYLIDRSWDRPRWWRHRGGHDYWRGDRGRDRWKDHWKDRDHDRGDHDRGDHDGRGDHHDRDRGDRGDDDGWDRGDRDNDGRDRDRDRAGWSPEDRNNWKKRWAESPDGEADPVIIRPEGYAPTGRPEPRPVKDRPRTDGETPRPVRPGNDPGLAGAPAPQPVIERPRPRREIREMSGGDIAERALHRQERLKGWNGAADIAPTSRPVSRPSVSRPAAPASRPVVSRPEPVSRPSVSRPAPSPRPAAAVSQSAPRPAAVSPRPGSDGMKKVRQAREANKRTREE